MSADPLLDLIARWPIDPPAAGRLAGHLARSAAPEAQDGPPAIGAALAADLGAPPDKIACLTLLLRLHYTAVDLADDLADGDLPARLGRPATPLDRALHEGDVQRLLLMCIALLGRPELKALSRRERDGLARLLGEGGLAMWGGQERDLCAAEAPCTVEEAVEIALEKSGEELAFVLQAAALIAGAAPAPYARWGRLFGGLVQLHTDLVDALTVGEGAGRDAQRGAPSAPLMAALADPALGPSLRCWLAGSREEPRRRDIFAQLIGAADHAPLLERLRAQMLRPLLAELPAAARGLRSAVAGLEGSLARASAPRARPRLDPDDRLAQERELAIHMATGALLRAPALEGAAERLAWRPEGLPPDEDVLEASAFGRLFALDALAQAGLDLPLARAAARAALADGARYFTGSALLPPDADTSGLALAVLGDDAPDGILEHLLAHQRADGSFPTWLGPASGWTAAPCPVTQAHAARGLLARLGPADPRTIAAYAALCGWIAAGHPSPFYGAALSEGLLSRALREAAREGMRWNGQQRAIFDDIQARVARGSADLRGPPGGPLVIATSLIEQGLRAEDTATDANADTNSALRCLIDAQRPDGSFPAQPFFRTVDWRGRPQAHGAEPVTTALALAALTITPATPLWSVNSPTVELSPAELRRL